MPNSAAWMDIARGELGTREVPGPDDNPRVLAYYADAGHPDVRNDETAWCAAFVGGMPQARRLSPHRQLSPPGPTCSTAAS